VIINRARTMGSAWKISHLGPIPATVFIRPTMGKRAMRVRKNAEASFLPVPHPTDLLLNQKLIPERGVSFQGESFIRRRFKYPKPSINITDIQVHFGFSTSYSEADTLLLAVSLPGQSYSLLLAINKEGHFMLKEEHDGRIFDAVIRYQNFIDGSRHSIYFERHGSETLFIVDHEEIKASITPSTGSAPAALVKDPSVGEVFVAGVNEDTAALSTFKKFKGCLSSNYVF